MHAIHYKPIAAIGASALTVAGALIIMIAEGSSESDAVAGEMSTGVTVTNSVGPTSGMATALPVSRAVPSITGTAELPTEEQGLPG